MENRTAKAQQKVEQSRQEVEARLHDLRTTIDREFGWFPTGKTWVLPMVAFAGGLALAAALKSRRPSSRS